jgi:tetratricopeptide (TPR) repeat protein
VRRIVWAAVLVLVAAAGIGAYLNRAAVGASPPPIPSALTDPPARRIVEQKRQAVLAAPRTGAAWGELAMAFDAHEFSPEAVACYRRAMDLAPDDARWPFLLARQLNREGADPDLDEVVRLYQRSADCPTSSSAHRATALLTLADLLTELGRGNEAAPLYQQARAADPSSAWAAYRIGMTLAEQDKTEEAAQVLRGLARNPYTRKKVATALAALSRRAGRTKDADGFDYTAGLLPPDGHWPNPFIEEVSTLWRGQRALMSLFVAQQAGQQNKAAVNTATALADQYPSLETQMLLLRTLVNVGDYPGAVAVADDILRDPDGRNMVIAHSSLGLAKLGLADRAEVGGRKAEADRLLVQAAEALGESVRLKPDYAPGYLYQAKALLRLGRLPEAERAARAGVNCRPEEWEMYLILADVLAASGRKADAIATVEQAVKLAHPNEPRPKQALEALKK